MGTVVGEQLPDDAASLKRIISELMKEAAQYKAEAATANLEALSWKEKYENLRRHFFGSSSEKQHKDESTQGWLFNEAETYAGEVPRAEEKKVPVKAHERVKRGPKPIPDDIPRVDILSECSLEERTCPHYGALRPEIGQEVREEVEIIPEKVLVKRYIIKKYGPCGCADCTTPVIQASGPVKFIPGSRFSNNSLAFFLTSKFVDAQPFYRMEHILSRFGIETPRATLCALAIRAGRGLGDLIEVMKEDIKASRVLLMDETVVQVLHERNSSPQSKHFMWVTEGFSEGKPIIFFHYHPSRSKEIPLRLLKDYEGYLQTDGYSGYDEAGSFPGIRHVGCLAHVRRKFIDAEKLGSKEASIFISMIGELYEKEATLRRQYKEGLLDTERFLTLRRKEQTPRLTAMHSWLIAHAGISPPTLAFGKAVSYALSQWEKITHYLDHELLTPDTNTIENAIRPFVIGRKNWLFSNTPLGAHASASIYSMIETAKANGHEPYHYLCYLFNELPKAKSLEQKLALLPYKLSPTDY
ncbi:MAG: Transposase IS66 family protein [Spirochaetes bacterium ADurb.Bin110]|nr:MAG: Transposase IS66 family protein [Spirochaetes bacterium ADurb.Bin110]